MNTAQPAPLYDKEAAQRFTLDIQEGGATFPVVHVFSSVSDSALSVHDLARVVAFVPQGEGMMTEIDSFKADCALFDILCHDVEGYGPPEEARPDNWKELIPFTDKQSGIRALLSAEIVRDEPTAEDARPAFRRWGGGETLPLRLSCYFDDQEIETRFYAPPAIPAQIAAKYQKITGRFSTSGKGRKQRTALPPSLEKKAEIYRMLETAGLRAEGYQGEPPLHHQALIVDELLSSRADFAAKK